MRCRPPVADIACANAQRGQSWPCLEKACVQDTVNASNDSDVQRLQLRTYGERTKVDGSYAARRFSDTKRERARNGIKSTIFWHHDRSRDSRAVCVVAHATSLIWPHERSSALSAVRVAKRCKSVMWPQQARLRDVSDEQVDRNAAWRTDWPLRLRDVRAGKWPITCIPRILLSCIE